MKPSQVKTIQSAGLVIETEYIYSNLPVEHNILERKKINLH